MPAPRPPFSLTLPSQLHLLPLAREFVETVCRSINGDPCFCEAIQLATHEALQNVIRHAHAKRVNALLEIQITPLKTGVEVRLLDEGSPFDVAAVPHLDPGAVRIGGRGVFLMRRLMDEVQSERRRPRGNILRMVKHYRASVRRHLA